MIHLQNFKMNVPREMEMRQHRAEVTLELRKKKREDEIFQRRNITVDDFSAGEDDQQQTLQNLKKLAHAAANTMDIDLRMTAVQSLRKLLSKTNYAIFDDAIKSNLLPVLVDCLKQQQHHELQYEAALALGSIAAGTNAHSIKVFEAGAVPIFIDLMTSSTPNVCAQAVWALGNIIAVTTRLCNYAIEHGIIQPLLSLVKPSTSISLLRTTTWAILNICRSKCWLPITATIDILVVIMTLVLHSDLEVLVNILWAFSFVVDNHYCTTQLVIDCGIMAQIITLLDHIDINVQKAALRALKIVVSYSEERMQMMCKLNALSCFPKLLKHSQDTIRKRALKLLSIIKTDDPAQVQAILNICDLVPMIIENMNKEHHFLKKKAAASVIFNLTSNANHDQICTIVSKGVIPPFCDLLSCKDTDVVHMILTGLKNMLQLCKPDLLQVASVIEASDGLEKIERLQYHENCPIAQLACEIVGQYFYGETQQNVSSMEY